VAPQDQVQLPESDKLKRHDYLETLGGTVAVILWLALFGAGLLLSSEPYRSKLSSGSFTGTDIAATFCLYTPLNAALLTLLAGFVGGCLSKVTYSHWGIGSDDFPGVPDDPTLKARIMFMTENPFASTMRSFLVYLAVVAGLYIIANSPFSQPTADQYARFAGSISLLSFIIGYDPTRLQDLINLFPRTGSRQK